MGVQGLDHCQSDQHHRGFSFRKHEEMINSKTVNSKIVTKA